MSLGTSAAPLRFAEGDRPAGGWRGRRYLALDGRNAFELSFWCGTCPFLFERQEGANRTVAAEGLDAVLGDGLAAIKPEVIDAVSALLPEGEYLPLLTELVPVLTFPASAGDYFAEEQVRTWGIDSFWGLPQYPRTPYYRAGTQPVGSAAVLHEFAVPMVPPSWNKPARVSEHEAKLRGGAVPAALAVSILDICQPATDNLGAADPGLAHWCLAHFLLDGHHKMQAAARAGLPVRMISLLSVDHSLASRDDIADVARLLTAPEAADGARTIG
jgi:hypothetical protein